MDSFEWNKIFMALGFTFLGLFAINEIGNAVFDVESPGTSGYATAGNGQTPPSNGTAETPADLGALLAAADAAAGERIFARCAQCHTREKGGANKIGPNLWDIIGSRHAHKDDFAYSSAMKAFAGTWAGFSFVGIPDKVSIQPGDNGAQTYKLLASPTTDLTQLIAIDG